MLRIIGGDVGDILVRQAAGDALTPVSLYLRLRDQFVGTLLLESSDYHGNNNSFSYLCFSPVARFELDKNQLTTQRPGQPDSITTLPDPTRITKKGGSYNLPGIYPKRIAISA